MKPNISSRGRWCLGCRICIPMRSSAEWQGCPSRVPGRRIPSGAGAKGCTISSRCFHRRMWKQSPPSFTWKCSRQGTLRWVNSTTCIMMLMGSTMPILQRCRNGSWPHRKPPESGSPTFRCCTVSEDLVPENLLPNREDSFMKRMNSFVCWRNSFPHLKSIPTGVWAWRPIR